MPRFAVIFPAAGRSRRFGGDGPFRLKKPFVDLKGRAVWLRSVEAFLNRDDVCQTILVLAEEDIADFKERFKANLVFMTTEIVAGGNERVDSVANALARVSAEADFVAVHDAARPLIAKQWIDAVFAAAARTGAAIPGVPISSTVKRVESEVIRETVPRDQLWAAQTPQVFEKKLLSDAFARRTNPPATDEAQLVERLGRQVTVVPGSPLNIKITTQDDFRMAAALLDLVPREKMLNKIDAPPPDDSLFGRI